MSSHFNGLVEAADSLENMGIFDKEEPWSDEEVQGFLQFMSLPDDEKQQMHRAEPGRRWWPARVVDRRQLQGRRPLPGRL